MGDSGPNRLSLQSNHYQIVNSIVYLLIFNKYLCADIVMFFVLFLVELESIFLLIFKIYNHFSRVEILEMKLIKL